MEPVSVLKQRHMLAVAAGGLIIVASVILLLVYLVRGVTVANQFPIIVAILALIGTLWTGAITFVGLLLKDSVDRRSAMIQTDSEMRLRMETALKAIEMISTAETEGAPVQERREAAIMVLSSLNQHGLALALGEQFLKNDKISCEAFVQIISQSLESGDALLRESACAALKACYFKLPDHDGSMFFPANYCHNWRGNISLYAKTDLAHSLIKSLLSKNYEFWTRGTINWAIYALYKMFMLDTDSRFQYVAATFAADLCNATQPQAGYWMMPEDRQKITYEEIRNAAQAVLDPAGDRVDNLTYEDCAVSDEIRSWRSAPSSSALAQTVSDPQP